MMPFKDSVIVFDCDGVLLDFVSSFNGFVEFNGEKYSTNPQNYNFDWCENPPRIKKLLKEYIEEKVYAPIMDTNLPNFMHNLMKNNNVYIVTLYPHFKSRVNNLKSVGIFPGKHYNEIYCCNSTDEKYHKIRQLNPDYYFEDCPEFVNKICGDSKLIHTQIFVPTYYKYTQSIESITRILKYKTFSDKKVIY